MRASWAILVLWLFAEAASASAPASARAPRRRPASRPAPQIVANALPGLEAQQSARRQVQQIYAADYARTDYADRRALAQKLIEQAGQTRRDTPAKFALLAEARDIAAAAGDLTTAFDAIDDLCGVFAVSKLEQRIDVLRQAAPAIRSPAAASAMVSMCMDLVDQCVIQNDFAQARVLLDLAEPAAALTRRRAYAGWVEWRRVRLAEHHSAYEAARPAEARLKHAPDDPDASLAVGRYLALVQGEWDAGLTLLARGSDAELKSIAIQDLETFDKPSRQLATAARWWELAERPGAVSPALALRLRGRAAYWYRRAIPGLDGLDLALAEERVRRYQELLRPTLKLRPPDAMELNGRHYRLHIAEVTWESAQDLCETFGGSLLSLETRLENEWMIRYARGRGVWIGALPAGQGWSWLSNGPFFFTFWGLNQPSLSDDAARIALGAGGVWETHPGVTRRAFICEWGE